MGHFNTEQGKITDSGFLQQRIKECKHK